ncbi:hypothetical protein ACPEEZ_08270 [Frigoribacterium sp. 2-23]|uniref:hypothetical protein n=1 Tax=Frigoribacterium sp. 2-23 TaxID=3415006 RepID=UPI003C6FB622
MTNDDRTARPSDAGHEIDDPTTSTATSEATVEEMQSTPVSDSPAVDGDIDEEAVKTLPGTGGPDDVGTIDVDPADLHLSGDSIPGHPKPESSND